MKHFNFDFKKSLSKKNVKYGSYSTALIAVVVALAVVFNLLVMQLPTSWIQKDLTSNRIYNISDKTKKVLKNLNEDITIEVLSDTDNSDKNLKRFLKRYEEKSKHIKVQYKNPAKDPTLGQKYASLSPNSLIVKNGEREKTINYQDIFAQDYMSYYTTGQSSVSFNGEGLLTGAIAYVTAKELPVIYNVTGHKESPLNNTVANMIATQNISMQNLNLLTEKIPDDCAALLINAPKSDYTEEEAQLIIDYLDHGGKAIIFEAYTSQELTNFAKVLASYGIKKSKGVILEGPNHYYQQPIYVVPEIGDSEITKGLKGTNIMLVSAVGLEKIDSSANVTELLSSSNGAYMKLVENGEISSFDKEKGDKEGPFTYAFLSEKSGGKTKEVDKNKEKSASGGKLIVIGAESLLDEGLNSQLNITNIEFFGNSLSYLCGNNSEGAINIPGKDMNVKHITIKAMNQLILMVISIIIIPVGVFIAGLVIWFKRRKK